MSILRRIRWGRVGLAAFAITAVVGVNSMDCDRPSEVTAVTDYGKDLTEIAKPNNKLLLDRVWIDHLPKDDKDSVNSMIFIDRDGVRVGAISRASVWRRHMEVFRWDRKDGGLSLEFPQVNKTVPVKAEARACDEAPKPLDLCLDVTILKKTVRLYSKKSWAGQELADLAEVSGGLPFQPDGDSPGHEPVDLQALLIE